MRRSLQESFHERSTRQKGLGAPSGKWCMRSRVDRGIGGASRAVFAKVYPREGWLCRLLKGIFRKKVGHDQISLVNSGLSKVNQTSCFRTSQIL